MQSAIFDEARRGDAAPGQGLGLGLSIAERIAQLLDAPLILRSKPDGSSRPDHSMLDQGSRVGGAPSHGTVFAVRVVRVGVPAPVPGVAVQAVRGLVGLPVLLVDNDVQALEALAGVLRGWGCEVATAVDREGARQRMTERPASLWRSEEHTSELQSLMRNS